MKDYTLRKFRASLLRRFLELVREDGNRVSRNMWGEVIAEKMPENRENLLFLHQELEAENPLLEEMYFDWRSPMVVRERIFEHFVHEFPSIVDALQGGTVCIHVRFRPDGYESEGIDFLRSSSSAHLNDYRSIPLE